MLPATGYPGHSGRFAGLRRYLRQLFATVEPSTLQQVAVSRSC